MNADGETWIQSGKKRIVGIISVLNKYYLQKYLLKMAGHLKGGEEEARKELSDVLKSGSKLNFQGVVGVRKCMQKQKRQKSGLKRTYLISSRTGQQQNPFEESKDSKGIQRGKACEPCSVVVDEFASYEMEPDRGR